MTDYTDHKKAQIDLAEKYDEEIAISLPFSWRWDNRYTASLQYSFAFSVAVTALDCAIGDLILDFACGSGWISEWLNRLGYRTIATDISPVLLDFAQKRMSCDSRINLDRFPAQFVECDVDKLPFDDETFDGIICMNSLHHMADYQRVLDEMYRVLNKNGRVVFSEPGKGHSQSPASIEEMKRFGVLERDVNLSEIYSMAKKSGFKELTVTPAMLPEVVQFTYQERQKFLNNDRAVVDRYMHALQRSMDYENLFFCLHKSADRMKTSRPTGILRAEIGKISMPKRIPPDSPFAIEAVVRNTGDTVWISEVKKNKWYMALGIKLCYEDGKELDYGRGNLSKDIAPGETTSISASLKSPATRGKYTVKVDMVCERVTWFEHVGSTPLLLDLIVE
jgi:ubiquinone/menaquinone biosynthesis C-methylase UbiE